MVLLLDVLLFNTFLYILCVLLIESIKFFFTLSNMSESIVKICQFFFVFKVVILFILIDIDFLVTVVKLFVVNLNAICLEIF